MKPPAKDLKPSGKKKVSPPQAVGRLKGLKGKRRRKVDDKEMARRFGRGRKKE